MTKKIAFVILFAIMIFPLYMMLIGSLQDIRGILIMPPRIVPHVVTLKNYLMMSSWPLFVWTMNTFIVTISTVLLSVLLSIITGHSFAFFKIPMKNILWSMLLIGIMIPRISLLIPLYIVLKKLNLSGTILGVILTTALSPFGIYLARSYFETIPKSIIESARMDGANEFTIIMKIVVPVCKPIVTALALFSSIASLQDYIWQMLVLQKDERQTLLVGMMRAVMIRGGDLNNVNPLGRSMAVGIILLIPLLFIFLIANKYFTQSLEGAIKE